MIKRLLVRPRLTGAHDAARIAGLLALGAVTVGACADSGGSDDRVIRTDSAGVAMVHYPRLSSLDESRIAISPEPDLIIGREGADPAYEFSRIGGIAHLADGSLVVADGGSSQLRFFNAAGEFLRSTGRHGDGPGEFRGIHSVWVTEGDSLVVWERFGARRLHVLSPGGEFVRYVRLEPPSFLDNSHPERMRGVLRDGRVVAAFLSRSDPRDLDPGRQPEHLAIKPLDDRQWDSLAVSQGPEIVGIPMSNGNIAAREKALTSYAFASAAGSTVALVDAADFRIELYDTDGRLSMVISAALPEIAVTPEIVDAYIAQLPENQWEVVRNAPPASFLPKIRTVFLDGEDRIWVERYFEPGALSGRWEVFGGDGTWIGRIVMPEGFARMGAAVNYSPGFSVSSGQLAGVWLDPETGLETVRVYGIHQR